VDPEFADLVPVFVAEARTRLEKLTTLAGRLSEDPSLTREIRRELHTLKGAGRMLRLTALAEVCHAAESAIQQAPQDLDRMLTRVADGLAGMVDTIAAGGEPVSDTALLRLLAGQPAEAIVESVPHRPGTPATGGEQSTTSLPAAAQTAAATVDVRVDSATVDELADRATRLRILSLGTAHHVETLYDLSQLAEQGVREQQPRQVLAVLATALRRLAVETESGNQRLMRAAEQQMEVLLGLQIQPLKGFLLNMARHARDLARSLGREVEVELAGEDTQLDRRIARELEDALGHLVTNAIDHGIELPRQREAAGKSLVGRVRIEAASAGSKVRLTISDDGAGIDPARVIESAVSRGMVDAAKASAMPREDVLRLLFMPGFSTRREVSDVSGRGVGLDVVAAAVESVGGSVSLSSQVGRGTTVVLDVPTARRGEEVILLRAGSLRVALPANVVQRVDAIRATDVIERDGQSFVPLAGRLKQFLSLPSVLGEVGAAHQLLLQGEFSGQPLRVAVDAVEGSEEVLVRPLARGVSVGPLIDGMALLSSGVPVGVLSPKALIQSEFAARQPVQTVRPAVKRLRVLLIDDSLVTREMERRLLEDAGFEVTAAGDAAEGLVHLGEAAFECVITDVEMPGMDGFALTRHIRAIPHFAQMPVVVVSTRDRPEDRLAGLEAGADAYIAKQGLDATELAAVVRRLAGR
jgi:two-component system, chemotaxis family, sensor kinase CheA